MSALLKRHVLARCVTAAALLTCLAVLPTPIALADNCSPGDFGAAAGCSPPAAAGGEKAESWPPTGVDWPPEADVDADSDKSSQGTAAAPIVMPNGATPATPARSNGDTTTTPAPAPIVPVGAAPTKSTSTSIVTPGS